MVQTKKKNLKLFFDRFEKLYNRIAKLRHEFLKQQNKLIYSNQSKNWSQFIENFNIEIRQLEFDCKYIRWGAIGDMSRAIKHLQ